MTRSNLYITLSDGSLVKCVTESSSAPEQAYIVEQFLIPLLVLEKPESQLALIRQHCTMDELRTNATYRYEIDLTGKTIRFYEENYNYGTGRFKRGTEITGRYIAYLKKIETAAEKECKRKFKTLTNRQLTDRANGLPDFKRGDEALELRRRSLLSNGKFIYRTQRNAFIIISDEPKTN